MGAPVEGWLPERIKETRGFVDTLLPYKHYTSYTDWYRPPGTTEDGIERHPDYLWQPGNTVHITATVNGTDGYLVGWFDWNNDGDLDDTGEMEEFGSVSI